jgi:hypothetical protein
MLVCVFLCALCTRDRGCSVHPAFPAPSFPGGQRSCKTPGASRRENAAMCLNWSAVIARSAATKQSIRAPAAPTAAFCNGEFPVSQPLLDALPEAGHSVRRCAWRTMVRQTGRQRLNGQNVAFCGAAKFVKWPLLKGQWRFGRLLCIGAAGIQGSGRVVRSPQRNTREETCVS